MCAYFHPSLLEEFKNNNTWILLCSTIMNVAWNIEWKKRRGKESLSGAGKEPVGSLIAISFWILKWWYLSGLGCCCYFPFGGLWETCWWLPGWEGSLDWLLGYGGHFMSVWHPNMLGLLINHYTYLLHNRHCQYLSYSSTTTFLSFSVCICVYNCLLRITLYATDEL